VVVDFEPSEINNRGNGESERSGPLIESSCILLILE
jgi:hypothetical protein